MPIIKQSSQEYQKALLIVFIALIMGQVMFMAVAIFITKGEGMIGGSQSFEETMQIVNLLLFVSCVFLSFYMSKKQLEKSSQKTDLTEKLQSYRAILVWRSALIEVPSFFGLITFLLMGGYLNLIYPVVCIALMISYMPSNDRIKKDLNLNGNEIAKYDNPETSFEFNSPK